MSAALARLARAGVARAGGDRRGTVAILAAVSLVMLVGAAGLALDGAKLYLAQATVQRVADQSAIAAAYAYSESQSTTTAQEAATSLANQNGGTSASASVSIVPAPNGDGDSAAMVVVSYPVSMSPIGDLVPGTSFTVSATAYAEIHETADAPCVIALGSGGITGNGGVSATATGCAFSTGGSISTASGASFTAMEFLAAGSISAASGSSITTTPTANKLYPGSTAPTDPYASAGVFSRLSTVSALTAASFPSVGNAPSGGTAQTCTTSSSTLTFASGNYGTISTSYYPTCSTINFTGGGETDISGSGLQLSGGSVVVNFCPGTYKINGVSVESGTTVTFNVTGSASVCGTAMTGATTFDIWNGLTQGGAGLTVNGPATYNIQGGITVNSNGPLVFNNSGGGSTSTFNVAGGIAISNGSATFPDGTYVITSGDSNHYGIDVNGAPTATFGNGSFNIAGGIKVGGGDTLSLGNSSDGASNGTFVIPCAYASGVCDSAGTNAIYTGGGGTMTLGPFTNFDINGPVTVAGKTTLGAGTYTINGAFNASASGGCCITGTDVTIVASGPISFGAGYDTINLSAPSTITTQTLGQMSTVVLASNSTSASSITSGATNTVLLGAVYFPNAALTFGGAGSLSGGGGCVIVDVNSLSFSEGSSASTNCTGLESTNGSTVSLVK